MENLDISFDDIDVENEFKKHSTAPSIIQHTTRIESLPITYINRFDKNSIIKEMADRKIVFYLLIPTFLLPLYINQELLKYDNALLILLLSSLTSFLIFSIVAFFCDSNFYKTYFLKVGGKEIGYKQTRLKKLYNKVVDYHKRNFATLCVFGINTFCLVYGTQDLIKYFR